jgi:TatD DNase family protein
MNRFVDTHSHLYQPAFDADMEAVVQRALDMGVYAIILPNIDLSSLPRVLRMSQQFPGICLPTVGLHPCDVKEDWEKVLQELRKWAFHPEVFPKGRIYAIGETGLDYYWDITFKEEQKQALIEQIQWSKELHLPIILHTRNSVQDTIDIVKENHDSRLTGVFHCFSGNLEEAKQIVEMDNFYLGIGGTLTYKNSTLPDILKQVSLDRILLETDAPYLTPVPHRGKRNESSYIPLVAAKLSEVLGISLEEVAQKTSENAERLFGFESWG